ncbi:MAG: InlB B-repeat-containing protein [Bacilli bacterium]|nr:InlB B-repeat-containing protein [Bacilli bacterium]
MKIGKRLLLLMLLFIPFVHTNAMTSSQEKALKETMDAFLRNNNIKYSNAKEMNTITPEMATSQNLAYTQCANFANQIYKNALNISIRTSTLHIAGCAYYQRVTMGNTTSVVGAWSRYSTDNLPSPSSWSTRIQDFNDLLQVGDIIVYASDQTGGGAGHTQVVYYVDSNPNNTLLIEANQFGNSLGGEELNLFYGDNGVGAVRTWKLSDSFKTYTKKDDPNTTKNEENSVLFIVRPTGSLVNGEYIRDVDFSIVRHPSGSIYEYNTYYCYPMTSSDLEALINTNSSYANDNPTLNKKVEISKSGTCRSKYSKMDIVKTVSGTSSNGSTIINKSNVSVGDTLTYTIKIKNGSNTAYSNLKVEETISSNATITGTPTAKVGSTSVGNISTDNNKITFSDLSVSANSELTIIYKVKVDTKTVGETIKTTGKVLYTNNNSDIDCDIKTATIENVVINNITSSEKQEIIDLFNSNTNINTVLNGIFTNGSSLDINKLVILDKTTDTNPSNMYLSKTYSSTYFNLMVYNNYYGSRTYDDNTYRLHYWENNWLMKPSTSYSGRGAFADTIYKGHFQTGDVLIVKKNGNTKKYVYLEISTPGFYGYYNNELIRFLDANDINDDLNYNKLFNNDLWVIVRPVLGQKNKPIDTPTVQAYTGTYDGNNHSVTVTSSVSNGTLYYSTDGKTWSTTNPTIKNVGTITVYVKVVGDSTHKNSEIVKSKVEIKKAKASAPIVQDVNTVYDGQNYSLIVSETNEGTIQYYTDAVGHWFSDIPKRSQAGDYTIKVRVTGDSNHTNSDEVTGHIVISKADSTITCQNKTYNGSSQIIATCSGGTVSNNNQTNAGNYTVTCTGDNNHNNSSKTCTINKKKATAPIVQDVNTTYTGSSYSLTVSETNEGTIQYYTDAAGHWFSSIPTRSQAGDHTIKVRVTGDSNHTNSDEVTGHIVITKADSTITCQNKTYNGEEQTIATCAGGTAANNKKTNAGKYTVTCTGDSNHNNTSAECTINKKKAATPIVQDINTAYTESNYSLIVSETNEGTIQYYTDAAGRWFSSIPTRSLVGNHEIKVKVTGDSNHLDSDEVTGHIVITKVDATITCHNKTYNGEEQTIATCTGGTVSNNKKTNAGEYTVTCAGDSNHNDVSTICTINKKKAATPIVQDINTVYDGENHSLIVSETNEGIIQYYTDVVGHWFSDIPKRSQAGDYTIKVRVTGDSNHTNSDEVTGHITILENNDDLVIVCSDKTYNGELQTIATCNGGTLSGEKQTNAGDYPVTCAGTNSSISSVCSIKKKKATTPVVESYEGVYDGDNHSVTVNSSNEGNIVYSSDNTTWNNSPITRKNIGKSTVYVKVEGDSNHIDSDSIESYIDIYPSDATITCENKTYNGEPQVIATCANGTISNAVQTNAGEYLVTCEGNNNYSNVSTICSIDKSKASTPVVEAYEGNYDEDYHSVTTIPSNEGIIEYSLDNINWNIDAPLRKDVGTTTVYIRVQGDINHLDSDSVESSITINSIDTSITCLDNEYNGEPQVIATCSNGTISNEVQTNAGDYAVTCEGNNNYNSVAKVCSMSKKKASTPVVESYEGYYDGNDHSVTVNPSNEGTIKYSTDNNNWNITNPTRKNVGTTTVYVKVSGDTNHLDSDSVESRITINSLDASISCINTVYNGEPQVIATCSNGTISNEVQTNAGDYAVTCEGNNNYNSVAKVCSMSKKKASTPVVESYEGYYDGNPHSINVTSSNGTLMYSTDNIIWNINNPTRTDVGTTTVYVKDSGNSNYLESDVTSGSITIKEVLVNVSIIFNSNNNTTEIATQEISVNSNTKLNKNTFVRNGYTFNSWNTKADGTGIKYEDEQIVNLNESLNLYAIWDEDDDVTADSLSYDEVNMYIDKIMVNTEADDLISRMDISDDITTVVVDTVLVNNKDVVYTGGKTKIYKNSVLYKEYTNIVIGDIKPDGQINSADLLRIRQHLLQIKTLTGYEFVAADVNYDNTINSADLLRVRQHLLGIKNITID